jgi:hypothetical protein
MGLNDLENVIGRARTEVLLLHADGEITTQAAGRVLVELGQPRLHAHADEKNRDWDDNPDAPWKDASDHLWPLEEAEYVDATGKTWRWAGGFSGFPDSQPIFSRTDYSELDVPLCYVLVVHGPLKKKAS